MDALLGQRSINLQALFDFSKTNAETKKHLKNVYAALTIATLSAAVGASVHLFTNILSGGFLSSIAGIGFILALGMTTNEPKNQMKRMVFLVDRVVGGGAELLVPRWFPHVRTLRDVTHDVHEHLLPVHRDVPIAFVRWIARVLWIHSLRHTTHHREETERGRGFHLAPRRSVPRFREHFSPYSYHSVQQGGEEAKE